MKFIIADDHPFTLTGTKSYIESMGCEVIDTASDGMIAFEKIRTQLPDVAILDINMPGLDGIALLERIRANRIPVKVIFLTSHNEMSIYKKASEYGVDGYLLKNFAEEELAQCVQVLRLNGTYLSPRINTILIEDKSFVKDSLLEKLSFVEVKVFELVAQHKSTKEIADLLFLSEKSVEGYRTSIIEKLEIPKEKNALLKFASKFAAEE